MNINFSKRILWSACAALLIVLLVLGAWIFQNEITQLSPDFTKFRSRQVRTPLAGVPRTTSYLGRIRTAESLLSRGLHSRAAIELTAAIKEKPELIRPYLLLGDVHLQSRDFGKITGLISELERRFPGAPGINVLRARGLIAREDFQAAQKALNESENEYLTPSMQLYKSLLSALQNNHTEAKELLAKIAKLPTKEPLILSDEGVMEVEMENAMTPELAEKVAALQEVYETFSQFAGGEDPHLFALIAKILAENGEPILARAFADVAIREDIAYVDAWMIRGYANFLLGNTGSALEDLRHAYRLDPVRPEVEYFLGLTLEKIGETTEAAMFFEKLLTREFPYQSEVRWKLIELLTIQGEMERVVELYYEQASYEPAPGKFISAMHTLINVLHQPDAALTLSATLLAKQPQNVLALNLRAWALTEASRFAEAEILLKKAEKLNPENSRTQLNFGLLKEREGDTVGAREFYKKCYELGQNQPFNSVVGLAVERYNILLEQGDEAIGNLPASSP